MAGHITRHRKLGGRHSSWAVITPRTSRKAAFGGPIERLEERALLSTYRVGARPVLGPDPALTPAAIGSETTPLAASRLRHAPRGSASALAAASSAPAGPMGVTVQKDIVYHVDGGSALKLDLYKPVGPAPAGGRPVVVAFPGGGWRWASKTEYGTHVGQLAQYGFVVAVADYTYSSGASGSHVWPADFEDVRAAVEWVRKNANRLGVNPDKIAAEGVSSGSYMANMLGTYPDGPVSANSLPADATGPGTPGNVSARVQAVVDFYGPTDLPALYAASPRVQSSLDTFLGGTPDQVSNLYQAASPINFVSPDDPPFLIMQGTADQAVPVTQSLELEAALNRAGVPNRTILLNGIGHGFEMKIGTASILPYVVTFLDQALGGQPITTGQTTLG